MTAVKAWETCSLALQAILNAISTFGTSGNGPKSAASAEVSPKSADSAASAWCVANFQLWNTLVDLKHLSPAPLRSLQLVLPQLAFKATDGLLGFTPPVPQWHVLPPAAEGPEPDFYLYDCCCQPPGVEVEADSKYAKSFDGTWEVLVTEREWREAPRGGRSAQRLLLAPGEMLELSRSKLNVLEGAQRLEDLAERQHLESCRRIEKDAAELLPQVREKMEDLPSLEAQLEALRVELRELDEKRREEELRLKAFEKEMGLEVAQFRSEKMLRASQLSRQLSEEEMITSSLTQLVQQQAEVLKNLEENG